MKLHEQIGAAKRRAREAGCTCIPDVGRGAHTVSLYHQPECGCGLLTELLDVELPPAEPDSCWRLP
jgi:hypothetical protein